MASFPLTVNGHEHHVDVPEGTSLLEVLRNDIGDKSAKFGCGLGQCGACVVLIDGHPTPACDTPVEYVRGEVQTLAGLGRPEALAPGAVRVPGATGRAVWLLHRRDHHERRRAAP